jgi:2-(1,2-epoxy-1,2-dihydrophenyl)acetyl-CoA isomerase
VSVVERDYETLTFEEREGVGIVTLNRPEAMNALNLRLKEELGLVFEAIAAAPEVRSVLLTGAGRAFCAGGDISEMDASRPPAATRARMQKLLNGTVLPISRLEKPVVAAINGHCHGLGFSIALGCDIAYAAESAVLSMAFTRMGLVPDGTAIHLLPRIVGLNRAKELVLSARRLSAQEALELGLISRVLPDAELLDAALGLATTLASGPTLAYGAAKRLLEQAPLLSLDDAVELESYAQAIMMASADHAEAVAAFAGKRSAVFTGT